MVISTSKLLKFKDLGVNRWLLVAILLFWSGFSSSVIRQNKHYSITKVVIDAGHGGNDPGCLGASAKEKDIALAIALKLGAYIEENLKDVKVIYTRKTDVFIELHERAAIANNNKADVFICIHCNAGKKDAMGAETYVMGLHRTADNLHVSKRENASVLMEKDYEVKYDGFNPNSPEAHIIFTLYQNAFLDQSLQLAAAIQKQFKNNANRFDRGVKQAGFLVLYKTTMPSILVETGFLTHTDEEKYLNSAQGQDEIATSIFKAFKEYKVMVETGKAPPEEKKEEPKKEKDKPKETKNEKPKTSVKDKKNEPEKSDSNVIRMDSAERKLPIVSADTVALPDTGKAIPLIAKKDSAVSTVEKNEPVKTDTLVLKTEPEKKETIVKKDSVKTEIKEINKTPASEPASSLLFRVQIITSAKSLPEASEKFKAAGGEKIYPDVTPEGLHKYMVGSFSDMPQALELQKKMREKGYPDAFVVAYKEGKRIPIQEALSVIKKK